VRKAIHLLLPAVALVLVGTWMGVQRRTLAAVERDIITLQTQLSAARFTSPDADPSAAKASRDTGPIDWKKIAREQQGVMGDPRVMMRCHRRLKAMTHEEILSALDEIAKTDLPANSRSTLEQMLVGQLVQLDPELALTKFIDCLQDERSGIKHQLPAAFQKWAKKDPQKAAEWFDQQIAAGKFASKSLDGRNSFRLLFEGVMIGSLLSSDPAAAALRLAELPEGQREEVINHNSVNSFKQDNPAAFAKLVREQLSTTDPTRIIARQASQMVWNGGYAKVTEYLNLIGATSSERSACVDQAAISRIQSLPKNQKVTREDIDALRDWVGSQSPDSLDRVTGKFLGEAVRGNFRLDFTEAAGLAVHYSQASGNDESLGAFLESWPVYNNHKEQALVLAEKIANGALRAQILKRLE
jgi:hypothetical protein